MTFTSEEMNITWDAPGANPNATRTRGPVTEATRDEGDPGARLRRDDRTPNPADCSSEEDRSTILGVPAATASGDASHSTHVDRSRHPPWQAPKVPPRRPNHPKMAGDCAQNTGTRTVERPAPQIPRELQRQDNRRVTITASRNRRTDARQRPSAGSEEPVDSHPTHPRRDVRQEELHAHEERAVRCSQGDTASELGKFDFRALLPSRIRTPHAAVRLRGSRCSLGLPPLQGFLSRGRESAFTGSPLSDFTDALARRPCCQLSLRGHQPPDWLVSFETASPLEVSHLVARTRFPTLR